MQKPEYRSALIVGTGPGLSASLARLFAEAGSIIPLRGSKERDGRRRTLLDPERIWTIPTDLPLLDLPYTLEEYLRIKSSVRSPSAPPISTPKSLF